MPLGTIRRSRILFVLELTKIASGKLQLQLQLRLQF
jgi:hypothetical protein